ncbi:hypothetical protein LSAT2_015130 [Lamellibrachia satsuma]|nr:hypothetical protein LSAT2_015130 [Lamellibrachia satsuma]
MLLKHIRSQDSQHFWQGTDEQLSTTVDLSATVDRHWPDKMRASFLLLLCVVLLATAAFANEAKSDAVSVDKQSEELTGVSTCEAGVPYGSGAYHTVSGNSNSTARKRYRTTRFVVAFTQGLPLVSLLQDWIA